MIEFPSISSLHSLNESDELAQKFSSAKNWGMGAFIFLANRFQSSGRMQASER
jgi:hypothetical protein